MTRARRYLVRKIDSNEATMRAVRDVNRRLGDEMREMGSHTFTRDDDVVDRGSDSEFGSSRVLFCVRISSQSKTTCEHNTIFHVAFSVVACFVSLSRGSPPLDVLARRPVSRVSRVAVSPEPEEKVR